MPDGVKLAVTYFLPKPLTRGERFPVLLEMLPYRKDDSFYLRDYPPHAYWARHGFASAKVDIRGTGSSEGRVPDREYSEQELDDAVDVVAQLAKQPFSSGSVGMWGISWGGFNAIQVAMRHPPALKAILAVHSADNVYRDGLDMLDGAFHVDSYHLQIHHENGLPRPPDYALDEAYFRDRFDVKPWFFDYVKHQRDGPYWRKSALFTDYSKLKVPAYLIGGLLDGYRDSVPRILENARVPIQAEIGPWNHAWPHDGEPGPGYEWGVEGVRWWNRWLKGEKNGVPDTKRFAVFVRDGHPPDNQLKTTPGQWRYEDWPIRRTSWRTLYPAAGRDLLGKVPPGGAEALRYVPDFGIAAGLWWGEPTGDMRRDDAGSLVFDGAPLTESLEIVGFPKVRLRASVDAPLAHFVARLEDVHPDGRVSLVAAALLNGSQRLDPLRPEALRPEAPADLAFDLHFTTWTFRPGHRVRLAVTNSQFPMIWPTPSAMTTTLQLGEGTSVALPVIPFEARPLPAFAAPEPREERPDAGYGDCSSWPSGTQELTQDLLRGRTRYEWQTSCSWDIGKVHYRSTERNLYATSLAAPAESSFRGDESHTITLESRELVLRSVLEVRSDARNFEVLFTRRLIENEVLVRERQWVETIPRDFQ
jgi:predicted acyl esterase